MFYLGPQVPPLGFKAKLGSELFTFAEANAMYIPSTPADLLTAGIADGHFPACISRVFEKDISSPGQLICCSLPSHRRKNISSVKKKTSGSIFKFIYHVLCYAKTFDTALGVIIPQSNVYYIFITPICVIWRNSVSNGV